MNDLLKNPEKKLKKLNSLAFSALLTAILFYQTMLLLQNYYIDGEATEFGLSNQDRILSLEIEHDLLTSLTAPDYFSRNRYITNARQNINILTINHDELLNKSVHFPLLHESDDVTRHVYEKANPYLEQMRDAVFAAVANNEQLQYSVAQQQSLQRAIEAYRQSRQLFTNLIDKGTELSSQNTKIYLTQFPILSWTLAGLIFVVMILNQRLVYRRSVITAKNQFLQLKQKLELEYALLKSPHEAVITLSTDGIVTLFSPSAKQIFGYSEREMIGKNICQIMPANSSVFCHNCFAENIFSFCHLVTMRPEKIELHGLRKNGEQFPMLLELDELKTASQHVLIGFIRDLSSEKKAELKLKRSEAKYRAVVEDQSHIICRYDANFNFSFVNRACYQYFHKSEQELLNSCFLNEFPLEVQKSLKGEHHKLTMEKPVILQETSLITVEGRTEWIQWTIHAIFDNDWLVEYQSVGIIITQQKEAELKLLQAKQEAEEANKAKSQFLSNISHELKTPLNAILGFSQLLESGDVEALTPEQTECVQHIYKAGKLLLALIGDVLELSKIETGNVKLSMEDVSVNEVILEALCLIDNIAKEHHIHIKTRFDPLATTMIRVDGLRFKQVLINLLSNAVKYNSENGSIVLRSKIEKNRVRISVKDSGKGIDESKLMELFQPFNRLGAEKTGVEGTGIGLCIAKNLVERMGGKIGAMNNADAGCCFWVEFPVIQPKIASKEHATELNHKLNHEIAQLQESLNVIGLVETNPPSENLKPQTQNAAETVGETTLH